jgi:hypothetical protein
MRLSKITLKPCNNDTYYNKIPAITNLVLSPFVVNLIIENSAITNPLYKDQNHWSLQICYTKF